MRRLLNTRFYCVSVIKTSERIAEEKLNFEQLHHISKVPEQPAKEFNLFEKEKVEVNKKILQLLERLALVNFDGEKVLETLKSSIGFAKRIECIDIKDKKALYTILEEQPLDLREDRITEGNCREAILENAKAIEEDYFISPPGNIPLKQEFNS